MNSPTENSELFEELPLDLLTELRRTEHSVSVLSPEVDRVILREAAAQFSYRSSRRKLSRATWPGVALAASVLLAFFVVGGREDVIVSPDAIYADHNRSGQIDIADLLLLAKNRNGQTPSQGDLDAFAMRLVSLRDKGDAS